MSYFARDREEELRLRREIEIEAQIRYEEKKELMDKISELPLRTRLKYEGARFGAKMVSEGAKAILFAIVAAFVLEPTQQVIMEEERRRGIKEGFFDDPKNYLDDII